MTCRCVRIFGVQAWVSYPIWRRAHVFSSKPLFRSTNCIRILWLLGVPNLTTLAANVTGTQFFLCNSSQLPIVKYVDAWHLRCISLKSIDWRYANARNASQVRKRRSSRSRRRHGESGRGTRSVAFEHLPTAVFSEDNLGLRYSGCLCWVLMHIFSVEHLFWLSQLGGLCVTSVEEQKIANEGWN